MMDDNQSHEEAIPAQQSQRKPEGWAFALGTFFYAGAIPFAPGTMGSIATMLIVLGVELATQPLDPLWWMIAGLVVLVLGIPVGNAAETKFARHDPGWFVLDEVSGVLITYAMMRYALQYWGPVLENAQLDWWASIFVALIFFRTYDIAKPWPIRRVERVGRGAGIMLDDVVAGVMAGISCGVLVLIFA